MRWVIRPVSAEIGEHGRVREEAEPVGDVGSAAGARFGVEQLPLVEHDDDRGAGGVDPLGETLVLVRDAVGRVDDEEARVGAVDGLNARTML